MNLKFGAICLMLISMVSLSYGEEKLEGTVIIFHAGSLTLPFEAMEKAFEAKYPGVDVQREPAGSIQCARQITDLEKPCDIMVSADYQVIDDLLIPKYADYNIKFARNQIVLCYTTNSSHAKDITKDNWFDILQNKNVRWGYADPNVDPCGYRSLMTMQLAETYYKKPGLYDKLLANCPKENVRPKSVDLISLLQTGNLDYAFEYLSVAKQHKLEYISLPDEINLCDLKYKDLYSKAIVKIAGEKPGEFKEMKGDAINYGATIIKNAPNAKAAIAFMEYLLAPEGGLKILADMGQPPVVPCQVTPIDSVDKIPQQIQKFVKAEK
jgi:molybdate/tungstate transport system substrate-binding protein